MIDTIVLESPYLEEDQAQIIENSSIIRSGIDIAEGELLYRLVTTELKGSYDSSIRINVKRDRIISEYDLRSRKTLGKLVDTDPYLQIELSLHKFVLGHNIYGGSDDLELQVFNLILWLEKTLNCNLPLYSDFIVKRLDYARAYKLDQQTITTFFKGLNNATYPRRRVLKYDESGIYFPGFYTTLKFYNKEIEFKKHDKKKLQKLLSPDQVKYLEIASENVLRIEVEIKAKKLKDIYNKYPTIKEINMQIISDQWEVEVMRVMKVSSKTRKLYNKIDEVERQLYSNYSDANTLMATWYRLSTLGYDHVRSTMKKTTFYRHINKLKDVGIVWQHTNIQVIDDNLIYYDFNPFSNITELSTDLVSAYIRNPKIKEMGGKENAS